MMFNTKIKKSLQTIAIDSCKLRIPLDKVKILDSNLVDYFAELNLNTGEVNESHMKRKSLLIAEKGIKTRYLIEYKSGITSREDLAILCNAKLLKQNYLKGITNDTLKQLYEELMAHKIVEFSFEDLKAARLSDTDIKLDVVIKELELRDELFDMLRSMTKFSQEKRGGVDFKKAAGNRGVQWGKREVANISHPHIKIYAKDIEMRHNDKGDNSTLLFVKTFNIDVITGLTRLEGTIKNAKHFYSLMPNKPFTMGEVLSISEEELYETLIRMIQRHLFMENKLKRPEKPKVKEKLGDKDIITIAALQLLVENSRLKNRSRGINRSTMTPLQALDYISSNSDCRKQKYRLKEIINDLWYEHIQTPEDTAKNIEWAKKHLGIEDEKARTKRLDDYLKLFTGLSE